MRVREIRKILLYIASCTEAEMATLEGLGEGEGALDSVLTTVVPSRWTILD